jgi:CDP-diacylglycerol--serine O-phosphatidyltransferase
MAIIFVICAALRLARFNVYQSELRDFFIGLPVPAAGATIASFVLFTHYFEVNVAFWVLGPLTVILAYLMVSTFRYPKDRMKALVLAPRNAFRMLVLGVVVIAAIHYASDRSPAIVLFPITSAYVLYGVVDALLVRLERKQLPSRLWAYGQEPPPAPPAAKREDLL